MPCELHSLFAPDQWCPRERGMKANPADLYVQHDIAHIGMDLVARQRNIALFFMLMKVARGADVPIQLNS